MKKSSDGAAEDGEVDKSKSWIYKSTIGLMGSFWATVALVEVMDLTNPPQPK